MNKLSALTDLDNPIGAEGEPYVTHNAVMNPARRASMALHRQRNTADRLQPCLFDRLIDEHPQQAHEPLSARLMSQQQLRQSVLRDLSKLLNTANQGNRGLCYELEHVRRSCLNYGLDPLAGKSMSEVQWLDVENSIRCAILDFEPRILPDTLQVQCLDRAPDRNHHNVLSLHIVGHVWCEPFPQEFVLRTDIDLESGQFALKESKPVL